ncbi:MAG: DNA primase [Bacteroidales bacterium]|nr:DNA primase [Bacteroidales bacterium]
MIKPEDIQKIVDATDIVDVVSQFVKLRKRGSNYLGLCPFHNEKTPSFNVNAARGIFKCFGCGEGGDAIRFLMKHEHFTYPESLRFLANRYGIKIEEKELTPQMIEAKTEKEVIYAINDFAQKYFHNTLLNDEQGKMYGLSYFRERELTEETIKTWELGYCKDAWKDFTEYALKNGYSEELLAKAGLTIIKENTENSNQNSHHNCYDRFRGRVIFPIYSVSGRPIGFTGRLLSSDKTKAKYVNSPESVIYSKGKVLFGLHLSKSHIINNDRCYLVEGNMDAIMMYQCGIKNVVATSGTALTEDQIRLLKRYTSNVTILYDGDAAGIHATFRAIDMFLTFGLKIKIVLFPDNEDPDSFARQNTQAEFQRYITEEANDFIIFKTNLLLNDAKNDPIKRAALVKEILQSISKIPDNIERTAYIQQCASILKMEESMLMKELAKIIRLNAFKQMSKTENTQSNEAGNQMIDIQQQDIIPKEIAERQIISDPYPDDMQERSVVSLLLNYGDRITTQEIITDNEGNTEKQKFVVATYVISDLLADEIHFDNPLWKGILDIYKHHIEEFATLPKISIFTSSENESLRNAVTALLIDTAELSPLWQEKYQIDVPDLNNEEILNKLVKETLLHLKWHKLERRLKDAEKQLQNCDNDDEKMINLLLEVKTLESGLNIIRKELHNIAK